MQFVRLEISFEKPVNDRNEKEGKEGGDQQAPDYRTSKGCVLFAAVAQPQRHRQHAEDHGQGSHQDRPESCKARGMGRFARVFSKAELFVGKGHH